MGPLFFLVMVNDLTAELPMYKYVDDCVVSEVVITIRRRCMDSSTIQQEIDNVNQWSTVNNMKLNVKKLRYSIHRVIFEESTFAPTPVHQ